eukprot:COSAG05_NODE_1331_length_5154_cov_14.769733_6_plen_60_part_00
MRDTARECACVCVCECERERERERERGAKGVYPTSQPHSQAGSSRRLPAGAAISEAEDS